MRSGPFSGFELARLVLIRPTLLPEMLVIVGRSPGWG